MSYTDETLSLAVYERLKALDPSVEASVIPRIRTFIPQALETVGIQIGTSEDRDVRNLLRKEFSITVASNATDLTTLLAGTQPIVLDAICYVDITDQNGRKVQMLADPASLQQDRPVAFSYGALNGLTLSFLNLTAGTYQMTANYMEKAVANVKQQVEPLLLQTLIGMVRPS